MKQYSDKNAAFGDRSYNVPARPIQVCVTKSVVFMV